MNSKLREGFLYTSIAQVVNIVSILVINMLLSRSLAARDFGIVTFVQIIATFVNLFTGEAVPSAIIQNKKLHEKDYGVLFNYSIILGIVFTLGYGALGYVFAFSFGDPIYIPVSWLMSTLVLASFLNCVPQGLFLKALHFRALSIRRIISSIMGLIGGVVSLLFGAGIYAIVIALVLPVIFSLIFNLFYVRINFTRSLSLRPIKLISEFLTEQAKFSVLNYGYRNIDNVLIGQFLGPTALGYYSKSYQLLSQPITLFLGIVTPVLQPVLSGYEKDVEYIRQFYFKMSSSVAFIAIPVSVFFAMNSREITLLLFGPHWNNSVLPMAVLSLSIWVQLLTQIITPIWQSRNLPKLQTRNGLISFILITLSIIVGITFHSIVSVAIMVSISYYVNFAISSHMLVKYALDSQVIKLFRGLLMPVLSGVACALILFLVQPYLTFASVFLTLLLRGVLWLVEGFLFLKLTGNLNMITALLRK
ncbi:lipopolysaccharide biosynthesis protein [Lacticaseibacillus paracasei]|uniref:lipopolysaccharide biosynthesis protein n=1 Tax=Lacticaseibacillus paracasei TaxID=1597 RepID=UPI002739CC40|nr:lipopolysaccharide biosynthesis protein [Lacticaseibacillus paracasei]MDP4467178.1 lipopolysaccharide biosynthesis protein [Lacticaseibacillus paracasei]